MNVGINTYYPDKINVAYNNYLVYSQDGNPLFPNSNIANYDIHPWYIGNYSHLDQEEKDLNIKFPYYIKGNEELEFLNLLNRYNSQLFEGFISNINNDYMGRTLNDLINTSEKFIYPIVMYNNDLFEKYETIDLDERLIKCIKEDQARIVFLQLTEGFFGINKRDLIWVSNLVKKYNFNNDRIIVLTSNMYAEDRFNLMIENKEIDNNFIIYCYSYFQHNLWFIPGGHVLSDMVKEEAYKYFNYFLNNNRTNQKQYHFLCFNRIVKNHRIAIFSELMSNPNFKDKFIVSIGSSYNVQHISLDHANERDFYNKLNYFLRDDYKHSKQRLLDFLDTYDSKQKYVYDVEDLEQNKADSFNIDAHSNSFLNIISESLEGVNTVFFSEKTYKPIIALQPFIMNGNPFSLKKLKDYGYKTFDKWWDESYDNETDYTKRLEKIVDVLEEISSWSLERCFQVTNEMEEVLIHNFNNCMSVDKIEKLNKFLKEEINYETRSLW